MNINRKLLAAALCLSVMSVPATAHDFMGQHDRALYAGAYLTVSFGDRGKAAKSPLRYGFSAGWRQQDFGASQRFSHHSIFRNDDGLGFAAYGNIDARVIDLNFSERGFERLAFTGLPLLQNAAYGPPARLGHHFAADNGEDGEEGDFAKTFWTGTAVVAVLALAGLGVAYAVTYKGD